MPDQADDLQATIVALDKLGQLYPDTFRVLLLAAKEALRPMDTETRLDGHTPAPIAVWLAEPPLGESQGNGVQGQSHARSYHRAVDADVLQIGPKE